MAQWQCSRCGVTENFDIEISVGDVQDCKCGGYLGKVVA